MKNNGAHSEFTGMKENTNNQPGHGSQKDGNIQQTVHTSHKENTIHQTIYASQKDSDWPEQLEFAANLLRNGSLVAFPTETVYGLGADALNAKAVSRIFAAKGRPSDNPLIVHISNKNGMSGLVRAIPEVADKLMAAFWPGALTMVFFRNPAVPDIVTAGLDTVAVRMPIHPVALSLIQLAGVPVAAPSANRSGRPSPTTAAHVAEDMGGRIPMILDGGACAVGVESTVLDVTATPPMILRPGGVTREMIEDVIGPVTVDPALLCMAERPRSPGMKYAHYAPSAPMTLFEGDPVIVCKRVTEEAKRLSLQGKRVGVLCSEEWRLAWMHGNQCEVDVHPNGNGSATASFPAAGLVLPIAVGSREVPGTVASGIFAALREFDAVGVDVILAEGVVESGIGHAVMNRLRKAAGGHIVRCESGKEVEA